MAKIAVIGSIAWDLVTYLDEPFVEESNIRGSIPVERAGGNALCSAIALSSLGHDVTIFGEVGENEAAQIEAVLTEAGVNTSFLTRKPGRTAQSLILVSPAGERSVINTPGIEMSAGPPVGHVSGFEAVYIATIYPAFSALMEKIIDTTTVFAVFPPKIVTSWPAHVIMDSQKLMSSGVRDVFSQMRTASGENLHCVAVTRGAAGASLFTLDKTLDLPAPKVPVVDSTGAGDAFAAGFIDAYLKTGDPEKALENGVKTGSASVQRKSSYYTSEERPRRQA